MIKLKKRRHKTQIKRGNVQKSWT